jgi:[ribosomal protein S5]-alanine N-acetyltransferase
VPAVRLARITTGLARALDRDAAGFEAQVGSRLGDQARLVAEVMDQTLAMPATGRDDQPWGGHLAVDDALGVIVGTCAFKSWPTSDGEVEIAYFTFPAFEGRGYATAMAMLLLAIAEADGTVQQVVAHTLPERNASARVLEKVGLQCLGAVIDPEDGRIWRWARVCSLPGNK